MNIIVNNVSISYEKAGFGKPLILLHGNGENRSIFNAFIQQAKENYLCYSLDSRNHGESERGHEMNYDAMCDDVADFIKKLNISNPTIVGFSDGGIVAILLAIKYPELIGKIVAMGANVTPDGLRAFYRFIFKAVYFFFRSDKIKMILKEPNITKEQLNSIVRPVAIVCGSRDMVRTKHSLYIANNIKGAHIEILKGETHSGYVVGNVSLYDRIKKYL